MAEYDDPNPQDIPTLTELVSPGRRAEEAAQALQPSPANESPLEPLQVETAQPELIPELFEKDPLDILDDSLLAIEPTPSQESPPPSPPSMSNDELESLVCSVVNETLEQHLNDVRDQIVAEVVAKLRARLSDTDL